MATITTRQPLHLHMNGKRLAFVPGTHTVPDEVAAHPFLRNHPNVDVVRDKVEIETKIEVTKPAKVKK